MQNAQSNTPKAMFENFARKNGYGSRREVLQACNARGEHFRDIAVRPETVPWHNSTLASSFFKILTKNNIKNENEIDSGM